MRENVVTAHNTESSECGREYPLVPDGVVLSLAKSLFQSKVTVRTTVSQGTVHHSNHRSDPITVPVPNPLSRGPVAWQLVRSTSTVLHSSAQCRMLIAFKY